MVKERRLCGREGKLPQKRVARDAGLRRGTFAAQEGETKLHCFAVTAEALWPVVIRKPLPLDLVKQGGQSVAGIRIGLADEDAEAVAMQVPRLQLVTMPADPQDADAVTFYLIQPV